MASAERPSLKVAYLGNYSVPWCTEQHVASSFELAGHSVTRIQEGETRAVDVPDLVAGHDLFVWTQTYGLAVSGGDTNERLDMLAKIRAMGVPSAAFHLDKWWDLPRADQIPGEPFFRCDYVMTADGGNQDRWGEYGINHRWSPPAVFAPECTLGTRRREYECDIAFVGSWNGYHPEWAHRQQLISFMIRTYGRRRFQVWPKRGAVRGQDLNDLYASARICVGDSCMVGDTGRYWSDRIPETLGRGGVLLHPHTEGLSEHFTPGQHLGCWELGNWRELRDLISFYLDGPDKREAMRLAGHEHVKAEHTYTNRVVSLIEWVAEGERLDW